MLLTKVITLGSEILTCKSIKKGKRKNLWFSDDFKGNES